MYLKTLSLATIPGSAIKVKKAPAQKRFVLTSKLWNSLPSFLTTIKHLNNFKVLNEIFLNGKTKQKINILIF